MADYIKWIRSKVGHDPVVMIACGGIIRNKKNEILLVRRKDKDAQWAVPGGYLEIGETPQQTIVREVFEETGISIHVNEIQSAYPKDITYENGDKVWLIMLVYQCEYISGEIKTDNVEISEAQFFAIDKIPDNLRHPEILKNEK